MLNLGDKKAEQALIEISEIKNIPEGTVILREGQYVKVVPVVLEGLIKVYLSEDRDFLLYYIKPGQSCILSFSAGLHDEKSRVFAQTVEPSRVMLIPIFKLKQLIAQYPSILKWYIDLFYEKYNEVIDTFQGVIFHKLDERIYIYLKKQSLLKNQNPLKITHREIAADLGTAREVVSRILKKLEEEHKIKHINGQIKIL